MSCGKIKQNCGNTTYSTCVRYEKELPEISKIGEDCQVSLEETTEDLYKITQELKEETDISDLTFDCIDNLKNKQDVTLKEVVEEFNSVICELKEYKDNQENGVNLCELNITGCGLELGDLEDECGENITTLKQLLQTLINK